LIFVQEHADYNFFLKKAMKKIFFIKYSTFILIMLILGGCGFRHSNGFVPYKSDDSSQTSLKEILWKEIEQWQGVPYKWGGSSADGVDCSGFAVVIFKKLFGINLPRSTGEQAKAGTQIPEKDLKPGDLVFFIFKNKTRHVGIYLGDRKFTHASNSHKKVMMSNLDKPNWRKAYWTSRRIISENYVQVEDQRLAYHDLSPVKIPSLPE